MQTTQATYKEDSEQIISNIKNLGNAYNELYADGQFITDVINLVFDATGEQLSKTPKESQYKDLGNEHDKLQKQSDLLTLGLLQEKQRVFELEKELKDMKANHNEHKSNNLFRRQGLI